MSLQENLGPLRSAHSKGDTPTQHLTGKPSHRSPRARCPLSRSPACVDGPPCPPRRVPPGQRPRHPFPGP